MLSSNRQRQRLPVGQLSRECEASGRDFVPTKVGREQFVNSALGCRGPSLATHVSAQRFVHRLTDHATGCSHVSRSPTTNQWRQLEVGLAVAHLEAAGRRERAAPRDTGASIHHDRHEFPSRLGERMSYSVAEGVGFEPTVGIHPQRFSRPSHSAALAPFRLATLSVSARAVVGERSLDWRRGWDSNPRKLALHALSKRADSAALAPLRIVTTS